MSALCSTPEGNQKFKQPKASFDSFELRTVKIFNKQIDTNYISNHSLK